jgi:ACT domain-containing protein
MPNEKLIYDIAQVLFKRVGQSISEKSIETIVAEIYEIIDNQVLKRADLPDISRNQDPSQRVVISAFGVDRPGIVAAVSQILGEAEYSIIDINQTVVESKFAMVMIVNMGQGKISLSDLQQRLKKEEEQLGVRIYAQREDLFNAMHRV